jgi:hypothetical protein
MPLDGRTEKRAPMAMAMNLVSAEDQLVTGQQARLVPSTGESGLPARVVYCQRLSDGLYCLGLEICARSIKCE